MQRQISFMEKNLNFGGHLGKMPIFLIIDAFQPANMGFHEHYTPLNIPDHTR